jgi:hypothetical protein
MQALPALDLAQACCKPSPSPAGPDASGAFYVHTAGYAFRIAGSAIKTIAVTLAFNDFNMKRY